MSTFQAWGVPALCYFLERAARGCAKEGGREGKAADPWLAGWARTPKNVHWRVNADAPCRLHHCPPPPCLCDCVPSSRQPQASVSTEMSCVQILRIALNLSLPPRRLVAAGGRSRPLARHARTELSLASVVECRQNARNTPSSPSCHGGKRLGGGILSVCAQQHIVRRHCELSVQGHRQSGLK
jgi:hypothetical protein